MSLLTLLLLVLFFIFVVGVCIGSFLNVVISRSLSNESIVFPGSKCPSCQTPLKWYHNIPILSYAFLKGKCAFCSEKISFQYPVVELVTGLLFVAIFIACGPTLKGLFMLIFASIFVVIAATDIRERVVFDFHTYALVVLGLIYNLFDIGNLNLGVKVFTLGHFSFGIGIALISSILGIILGIIIMEIFARFGYLVAGTRAFGVGDTYIAAGLGAIFGLKLVTVLLYAFIIQVVLTIPIFVKKLYLNKDYTTMISFGIFLILTIIMKWLEYNEILANGLIFWCCALLLLVVGVYLCKRILNGIRSQENLLYLPFGPALVLGAIITMFLI